MKDHDYTTLDISSLAYVAGIVDGEGCILIETYNSHKYGTVYILCVKVTNTDINLINYLHKYYGGFISCKARYGNSRNIFKWFIKGRVAAKFLHAIFPYLVMKQNQAIIAFEFMNTFSIKFNSKNRIPINILEIRKNKYKELQEVKKVEYELF